MVRLDRITMQGFKSFAGKITIPFPEGFNVIAGPNGSGKSNVVDAITFVLGTTSARSIRAQKLKALIFNGGGGRKPAEFCEVSIYFDNSDNRMPVEKELKISRRITRSGISIYKLNGRTVTRAKIMDIISQGGMTSEGHNIIMQGDVTQIIEMNSKERRIILDDISGISEFDDKKEKAERELEKVETRVRENMIVVAEKQRLVQRLKEEKETAEKYVKLEDEMRKAKASLFKKKFEESAEKMSLLEKEISEASNVFESAEKDFDIVEKELEEKEKGVLKKSEALVKNTKNYEIQKQVDSIQTEIIRKKDRIDLYERELSRLKTQGDDPAVKEILSINNPGVHGKLIDLIKIPNKYSVALSTAIGRHANDIVVDDENVAASCIKHLKQKKVGRARFIPLSIIKSRERKEYKGREKIINYAMDLVEYSNTYSSAVGFVLGSTLVVNDIDIAKKIRGFRIVTMDGDLVESSGVMIGGFLKRKSTVSTKHIEDEIKKLDFEIDSSQKQIDKISLELEDEMPVEKIQTDVAENEKVLDELRLRRKQIYENRLRTQSEVGKKKIEKARLEATLDNMRLEEKDHKDIPTISGNTEELEERARRSIIEINKLGPVNMKALDEYSLLNVEFEELKKKLDKFLEEKDAIIKIVEDVSKRRYDKFMETMNSINENFVKVYNDLTGGDGQLRLEEDDNIESGLLIEASPKGKKILSMDSMSGGEKSMTSLAFLFSILQHYRSPFYILDEVDAALDKSNTKSVMSLVKNYSKKVQFIVISHSDTTISEADKVFGVSMEGGVSKVFGIELPHGDD